MENPKCLETFKNILATRKDLFDNKNIIFIMSKIDGWKFKPSATEKAAKNITAKEVRKLINDGHEVMSYRPKGGKRNYEHESMMIEMMKRLDVATVDTKEQNDVGTEENVSTYK